MGTIVPRKRADGSTGYRAQIILKRKGKIVHQEAKTFSRRQAASAWLETREKDLARPGALDRKGDPILSAVIDRYIEESNKALGRTKEQVLRTIKAMPISDMRCSKITSADIVAFAKSLDAQPQTRGNYLSHLAAVFSIARPMWGYALDQQAMKDAFAVCNRMGVTGKSAKRDRRPTIDELNRLMDYFDARERRGDTDVPMTAVVLFAMFSTRRLEEITRVLRKDYEPATGGQSARVLVRDMKNPGDKKGNNVWCDVPAGAAVIAEWMLASHQQDRLFPFNHRTIGSYFTAACAMLGIDDLHFHDLRHEGVSRLFEIGTPIPNAAKVSGHRSWSSLQRYSHIRQTGDKYEGWKWKIP